MTTTFFVWLIISLAFLLANVPFINERLLGVIPLRSGAKSVWLRLAELTLLYFLVGAVGLAIEFHQGQIYPQGWQFYAVTVSLFLTFAFPGFVYRYLVRRR